MSRTKTSRLKEKATSFFLRVVPTSGLLGRLWYLVFPQTRKALELPPVAALKISAQDLDFFLLPEFAALGFKVENAATSIRDRMRFILANGFAVADVETVTGHSLRATVLACMNTRGCDPDVSELLGHHVHKVHSSALT